MDAVGQARWLDERRKGIGGTDAAAILGLSKYATEHDVWLRKQGLAPEVRENEAMWWGRELEDIIARRYSEVTSYPLLNPQHPDGSKRLVYHPDHPELIGSPDRLVVSRPLGLEIKTASVYTADEWGREGTDEIPLAYVAQCAHYMAITGFPRWDVAVLIGGSDFRLYHLHRDEAMEQALVAKLIDWWQRRIVQGEEPPIDGSEASARFLAGKYPAHNSPRVRADAIAEEVGLGLLKAREEVEAASAKEQLYMNRMKQLIGDAEGMDGEAFRVTWMSARGRTTTDWRAVAEAFREQVGTEAFEAAINAATVRAQGNRPFRFSARKESMVNA